jgi:small-conductance mechanosensitive channel
MDELTWHPLLTQALIYLPRLGLAFALLLGFWALGSATQRFVGRLTGLRSSDRSLIHFAGSSAKITLLVIGIVTALGTLGVNVNALVAGLGLTGFALGFAMRDLLSNALSGFMILFNKPFLYGDRIEVTSLAGTVVEVNFRYTVLDAEEKLIYIPNANLFTNPVIVTKRKAIEVG